MSFYYDYYRVDDNEISITVLNESRAVVHTENILIEWEDEDDIVDAVKSAALSHGFAPVFSLSAASLGAKGGRVKSESKAQSSRENGKKGGRPKGSKKTGG